MFHGQHSDIHCGYFTGKRNGNFEGEWRRIRSIFSQYFMPIQPSSKWSIQNQNWKYWSICKFHNDEKQTRFSGEIFTAIAESRKCRYRPHWKYNERMWNCFRDSPTSLIYLHALNVVRSCVSNFWNFLQISDIFTKIERKISE